MIPILEKARATSEPGLILHPHYIQRFKTQVILDAAVRGEILTPAEIQQRAQLLIDAHLSKLTASARAHHKEA